MALAQQRGAHKKLSLRDTLTKLQSEKLFLTSIAFLKIE